MKVYVDSCKCMLHAVEYIVACKCMLIVGVQAAHMLSFTCDIAHVVDASKEYGRSMDAFKKYGPQSLGLDYYSILYVPYRSYITPQN